MATSLAVDPARFRHVLGHHPTGVTAVTAQTDAGPVGLAIGSFSSISLDPPLVGFFATVSSFAWAGIRDAGAFTVNVLADDQEVVCRRFASSATDKFGGLDWHPGPVGAPRITGALAWIDCAVHDVHRTGDHDLCVGAVADLAVRSASAGPLLFFRGGYGRFEA